MSAATTAAAKADGKEDKPSVGTKKKPVLKKKPQEDDTFASEGEADAEEAERKQTVQAKKGSEKRSRPGDVDADVDDSDGPKSKKTKSA
jgi:hypothetical protein